jgi:excisionase family DNA binding protein
VEPKYPLLEEILRIQGRPLKATYTNPEAAEVLEVDMRTIQKHVKDGTLPSHKMMGGKNFLASDLEQYLQQSRRPTPE